MLSIYPVISTTQGLWVYSAWVRKSTRNRKIVFLGSTIHEEREVDNLNAISEPIF
jgi:hypothetical protein